MNDSTGQESDEEDGVSCLTCGDSIDDGASRRVVPTIEDGAVVRRQFCDDACLAEWRD